MKRTYYYLTIAFISLIVGSSCERIEIDNDDKQNPMELSIESSGNIIQLSWTKTNISSFSRYILVRSPEPFPEEFTSPNAIFWPMEAIISIEDIDENTYEDFASVLSEKVYYRVFADIGNRFLSSGDVEADISLNILSFQHDAVSFSPELDQLFLVEENSSQFELHKINYKTNAASSSSLTSTHSYYINLFMENNSNNEEELFISNNYDNEFTTYSPNNLTQKKKYFSNSTIFNIATSSTGLICAAIDDYQGSLHIYFPGNSNPSKSHNYSTYYSARTLASISDSENEFIEASNNELHYYKFSNTGDIVSHSTSIVGGQSLNEKITVSPDNQYFIAHSSGVIYNKDLSIFKTLNENQNNNFFYRDFAFSADGSTLYTIEAFSQKIMSYSFPDLELKREVKVGYPPLQLFADEGKLIVLGTGFHNQSSSYRSIYQVFDF